MTRTFVLLLLVLAIPATGVRAAQDALAPGLVLAGVDDPYYALAIEIAQQEDLPLAHTLDEVLARDPAYLLWVVSPGGLSDAVLVEFGLAMRDRPSALPVGIITGSTLEDARALWQRGPKVRGERVVAANAANPAGHIEAGIRVHDGDTVSVRPLTLPNLLDSLETADYMTFTGHGGRSFLALDADTKLRPEQIPALPPVVVATGSCNTFRPWEENSIALAFVDRGAAVYAGFVYSPNSGYLIGAFEGLPFRYTWPEYPIGHAIQVQNHGTLQGFAQFPYYYLLGDPRIALQDEAPYRLLGDEQDGVWRTLTLSGAPAGTIPVRIPGGAGYAFVRVPGVGSAWAGDPFYNARLQMADLGGDKYLLVEHGGGDLALRLRARPPWYWVPADALADALDGTLLYLQEGSGDLLLLIAGVLALVPAAAVLLRDRRDRRVVARRLALAALAGLGFAALHGLYALARLDALTITSKMVVFHPLSLPGTFLLAGCGAVLYLSARSWSGRVVGLLVALLNALLPAVIWLGLLPAVNALVVKPELGTHLWNYAPGWQAAVALGFDLLLFGLVFWRLDRIQVRLAQKDPALEHDNLTKRRTYA